MIRENTPRTDAHAQPPRACAAEEGIKFPAGFLEAYDPVERLSQGHDTQTLLARKKADGKLYVAKCYDRAARGEVRESAILQALSCEGLPRFEGEYRDGDAVLILREYIEGTPLDRYANGRCLPPAQVISLGVKLCDILICLHAQRPPIIHRDIKPQNVIVRENGEPALIDFDIARRYEPDAQTDTRFIGTRCYAPPEQYGFSQTDCRTDIYSLGVLLCYLLSGQTDVKSARLGDERLAGVLRRCTAFAPEQRFASAAAVKRALLRAGASRRGRALRACAASLFAVLLFLAGFALGRFTDFPAREAQICFAEPLMERAVRAQLGKAADDPITAAELGSVRAVYLFGTEVSDRQESFFGGLNGWTLPRGDLNSLEDLALLPNLEVLYVNYQPLSDISQLSGMQCLRYIDLRHTFVGDISALAGLKRLEDLVLFDTNVKDLSPLTSCPRLSALDIGRTLVASVAEIPELPALKWLSLRERSLQDLKGLERFPKLEWLCLSDTGVGDLSPLLSLPKLSDVQMDASMRGAAEALGETPFTVQYE